MSGDDKRDSLDDFSRPGESNEILNVRSDVERRRSRTAGVIEWCGRHLAQPTFFVALLLLHVGWLILNSGVVPGVEPWDPYPFTLLATIASVEAPFLSLLILMRQYRDSRVQELRGEIALQVALHTEREVTAVLRMLEQLHAHAGLEPPIEDEVLAHMRHGLDPDLLLERVRRHLHEEEGDES